MNLRLGASGRQVKILSFNSLDKMKSIFKLYPLFFFILNLNSIVESEDSSPINDELNRVIFRSKDDFETKNNKKNDEHYNTHCTYTNGKDPNIRKNIEEIIKVLVKDSLPLAMKTPDEQVHELIARDIQVAANQITIQLALHASKITQKVLQSIEKANDTQTALDTEMQHCALLPTNNVEDLTNTTNMNNNQQSEAIAIISNKITALQNLTSSENAMIRDMLAIIEKNQKSLMNYPEQQTSQKVEDNVAKVSSLCDVKVPISLMPKQDISKRKQNPVMDYLDTYMVNKTGCSYVTVNYGDYHKLARTTFSGQLEWRVAVRARGHAAILFELDSVDIYTMYVGETNNTMSSLHDWTESTEWEQRTPLVLAEDRYVPLYYRINNGTLTAGLECNPEPLFTTKFTVETGKQLQRKFTTWSRYGAKYLYECPDSFTGQ